MGWGSGGHGSVPHGSTVSVGKIRKLVAEVVHYLKTSKVTHFLR